MHLRVLCLGGILLMSACSLNDSRMAHQAQSGLLGFSERDLETCLGVPNRKDSFGQTTILSYDGTSTSTGGVNVTLPVVGGGVSVSGGGYCHLEARLDNDRVTSIRYAGEKDATLAPDAYCASLVRGCFARLPKRPPAEAASPTTAKKSSPSP
jgi:hypothetical protein